VVGVGRVPPAHRGGGQLGAAAGGDVGQHRQRITRAQQILSTPARKRAPGAPQDVVTILEAPDSDWEDNEEDLPPEDKELFKVLRADAEDRYLRLHVEAGMALEIALATGEFQPDRYTRTNNRSSDWTRQQP